MKVNQFTGANRRDRSSAGNEPRAIADTKNSVRERERRQMQAAVCIEYRAPKFAYQQAASASSGSAH